MRKENAASGNSASDGQTLVPAAQYVRMSTEHQQYSTANQSDAIEEYARRHGYRIVKIYKDEGKSGLKVEGRAALAQLLEDVKSGVAAFNAVLVYDVSRWGRFQDSDESAFYEYTCRLAGIRVEYCAEQFTNDNSLHSNLVKTIKRVMAGEYSRELSNKVFAGQCRLIRMGFRQGGTAGYGLRRMLVGPDGRPKSELKRGEHKSLQTDRVILVPGPEAEISVVKRMYEMFTRDGMKESEVARALNDEGVINADLGRPWTAGTIREILTNEKYIGHNVFNRSSFKLKQAHVNNPPDEWVRANLAFKPIIDAEMFFVARGRIVERSQRVPDEELLEKLRMLLAEKGTLSAALINNSDALPSSCVYQYRFGNLLKAYERIGFKPDRDFEYLEINRRLRELRQPLMMGVVNRLGEVGANVAEDDHTGILNVNGQYSVDFVMARSRQGTAGALKWMIDTQRRPKSDITVVVRMDAENKQAADYYLLPSIGIDHSSIRLRETNGVEIETFRFDTLNHLVSLAAREEAELLS